MRNTISGHNVQQWRKFIADPTFHVSELLTQTRTRYVDIDVVHALGNSFCRSLPGLHSFTGCDTVHASAGRGKVNSILHVKRHSASQETFQHVRAGSVLLDELFLRLQKFTCLTYSTTPGTEDVNKLKGTGLF